MSLKTSDLRRNTAARYAHLVPKIREMASDPAVSKRACHEGLRIGWETLCRILEEYGIAWVSPNGAPYSTRRNRSLAEQYATKLPEIRRLAVDPDVSMQRAAAMLGMDYHALRRVRVARGIEWQYDARKPHRYRGRVTRPRGNAGDEQVEKGRVGGLRRKELSRSEQVRDWLVVAFLRKG